MAHLRSHVLETAKKHAEALEKEDIKYPLIDSLIDTLIYAEVPSYLVYEFVFIVMDSLNFHEAQSLEKACDFIIEIFKDVLLPNLTPYQANQFLYSEAWSANRSYSRCVSAFALKQKICNELCAALIE